MMFINCGRATKDHLCQKLLLFTAVLAGGICQLYCPGLTELENSAQLTCIYPHDNYVSYRPPYGNSAVATCKPDGNCSVTVGDRFSVTYINKTHSRLMITNVQVSDGGKWICEDAFNGVSKGCIIYPFKTPTCHITSENDTNNLDIHENILLSVTVTDYYCSTPIDFLLRAGKTEEVLIKQTTVKETYIKSDVFNSTFNVTESHIGSMELIFTCNNVEKTVQCGGVQTLKKRPPPLCNITANRNEGLNVGEEITMSVYIEDYFCSCSLEFFLRTGGETDRLNVTGIYNETITFKVIESHFGPVSLEMNCNYVSRNLTCDGIQELSKRHHASTSTPLPGMEYGVLPTFNLLLLFGLGTGVAATLLLVGLCHLVIYLMRRKNTVCLSGNHYDEFEGRNVDAKTGYDEIGMPRSQETDTAEEMTGNQYYNLQGGNDDETHGYVEVDILRSRGNIIAEGAGGEAS